MISRSGGRDSKDFAISASGRGAWSPRMIGCGAIRIAPGIRWLTAGYTKELVTSSGTATPASNFALADAGSMRGARIIDAVPGALRVAARAAPRPLGGT